MLHHISHFSQSHYEFICDSSWIKRWCWNLMTKEMVHCKSTLEMAGLVSLYSIHKHKMMK